MRPEEKLVRREPGPARSGPLPGRRGRHAAPSGAPQASVLASHTRPAPRLRGAGASRAGGVGAEPSWHPVWLEACRVSLPARVGSAPRSPDSHGLESLTSSPFRVATGYGCREHFQLQRVFPARKVKRMAGARVGVFNGGTVTWDVISGAAVGRELRGAAL